MPHVGDVVFIHLRNEGFKCHAVVLEIKDTQFGLPIRVQAERPLEYFYNRPLNTFSIALNEIVEVADEGG